MRDFCIVGTGISGSTIANLLKKKYSIQVIDKARGLGGRSSNKRYKRLLSFDLESARIGISNQINCSDYYNNSSKFKYDEESLKNIDSTLLIEFTSILLNLTLLAGVTYLFKIY